MGKKIQLTRDDVKNIIKESIQRIMAERAANRNRSLRNEAIEHKVGRILRENIKNVLKEDMNQPLYWSKLFQSGDEIENIENILNNCGENYAKAVAIIADTYDFGDDNNPDDYQTEMPFTSRGGGSVIDRYKGYELVYDNSLGGVYMLWREATPEEKQWYFNNYMD